MCYTLEHYFKQIDNLSELHLKNSKSTEKSRLGPSLGQDGPLFGATRPITPSPVVFAYMNKLLAAI